MACRAMKASRAPCTDPAWAALAAMRSSRLGVCTVPGQIALQRTPWRTVSAATLLVSPITAALLVPYTQRAGAPLMLLAPLDMLMMEPRPRSIMPGRAARMVLTMLRTLSVKAKSHSASVLSRIVPWWTKPAQLNRMSSGPAAPTAVATAAASVTSSLAVVMPGPSSPGPSSPASFASSTSVANTRAPSAA